MKWMKVKMAALVRPRLLVILAASAHAPRTPSPACVGPFQTCHLSLHAVSMQL